MAEECIVVELSSTRYLQLSYYNNTNYRLTLFSNTFTVLDTYDLSSSYVQYKKAMAKMNSSTIICLFSTSTSGFAALVNITADTISLGTGAVFTPYVVDDLSIDYLDSNSAIIAYTKSNVAYAQILTYSLATITANTLNEIGFNSTNNTENIKIKSLTTTTAFIVYSDVTNTECKAMVLTIDDKIITLGSVFYLGNLQTDMMDLSVINSQYIIIAATASSLNKIQVGIIEVNGVNIGIRDCEIITTNSVIAKVLYISDGIFVLSYYSSSNAYIQLYTYDANYQIQTETLITSGNYNYLSLCNFNGNVLFAYPYNATTIKYRTFTNFATTGTTVYKEAIWINNKTTFLANFENSLSSGNISSEIETIRIKRKAEDGNFYVTLADLSNTTTQYIDTTARNNITYNYILNSVDIKGNEDLGSETTGKLDFYGWFLTDGSNIYKFDADLQSGNITTNRAINVIDTYQQYPTVSFGNKNYRSGNLSTIPYSYNSTDGYSFTYNLLEELRAFINNETTKYLKNTKGEILKVITSKFDYQYNDVTSEQIFQISFDWVEIGVGETGL